MLTDYQIIANCAKRGYLGQLQTKTYRGITCAGIKAQEGK